jgi:hypothetical protein
MLYVIVLLIVIDLMVVVVPYEVSQPLLLYPMETMLKGI